MFIIFYKSYIFIFITYLKKLSLIYNNLFHINYHLKIIYFSILQLYLNISLNKMKYYNKN